MTVHWPVLFDIDIPVKYDNPKRCVLNGWAEIGRRNGIENQS